MYLAATAADTKNLHGLSLLEHHNIQDMRCLGLVATQDFHYQSYVRLDSTSMGFTRFRVLGWNMYSPLRDSLDRHVPSLRHLYPDLSRKIAISDHRGPSYIPKNTAMILVRACE